MAQFNAEIAIKASVEQALKGVSQIEKALAKIQDTTIKVKAIGTQDIQQAVRSYKVLRSTLLSAGKAAAFVSKNFVGLVAAAELTQLIAFANNIKQLQTPLSQAAAAVAGLTGNVVQLASAQPLLTAQIAAGTVALAAFGPQIATATGRLIKLAATAAGAKAPLQELLNTYSTLTGAFDGSFAEFDQQFKTEVIEAYRRKLFEISETVSELSRRKKDLQANLDRFNSSSDTAVKIATKLVDVQARLNDELREQKDLLRQAAGVNVTELEASKGRNSIATKDRREQYLADKASAIEEEQNKFLKETAALKKALNDLDERGVSALEEKLNVTRRITNEKSLQAQKEKNSQLQGQSMRIPTPYTNAAAKGFPYVALPQTKQEAKIAAAERARAEAKVSLERQKSNSLLADGVTALRLQIELAKQLGPAYEPYLESLRKVNKRQGQLFRGRANRAQRKDLGSQNLDLFQRVNKLATNRVLKEKLINKTLEIGVAIRKNDFDLAKKLTSEAEELLKIEDARIDSARRLLRFKNKQKDKDKAAGAAQRKKNARLGENLALGAGFPLLFGAGPGGVAGGVAGAFLSGDDGFGLQILLSALGTRLDELGTKAIETAKALKTPLENFDQINEQLYLFDRAGAASIKRLQELGRSEEALARIRAKLDERIGTDGVQTFAELEAASKDFNVALSDLSTQLQLFVAGPLTAFLKGITEGVKDTAKFTDNNKRGNDLVKRLSSKDANDLISQIVKARSSGGLIKGGSGFGNQDAVSKVLDDFEKRFPGPAKTPTPVKRTPEQELKDAEIALSNAEKAESLRKRGIDLERQVSAFRRSNEDTIYGFKEKVASIERQNIELRRSVENQIFSQRQALAKQESDNIRKQQQLEIDRQDLALSRSRTFTNAPGEDLANSLSAAVRQYVKTRAEGEANLQQKERNFTLETIELEKRQKDFELQVQQKIDAIKRTITQYERSVTKYKLDVQIRIDSLQRSAADYQLEKAKERIRLESDHTKRQQATEAAAEMVRSGNYGGGSAPGTGAFPMTSGRGPRSLFGRSYHHGQDYATPMGTALSTKLGGRVTDVGEGPGYGKFVEVLLENGMKGFFAHLDSVALKVGQEFDAGDLIARTGNTGQSTGPHLHSGTANISNAIDKLVMLGGTMLKPPAEKAATAAMPAAPTAPSAPGVTDVSALTTQGAQLNQDLISSKQSMLEIEASAKELADDQALKTLSDTIAQSIQSVQKPLDTLLQTQQARFEDEKAYARLLQEGIAPAVAQQTVEIERQVAAQLQQLDALIARRDSEIASLKAKEMETGELEKQLEVLKAQRGIIEGKGQSAVSAAATNENGKQIRDYMNQLQGELNDTDAMIVSLAQTVTDQLGTAMSDAITGLIDGTTTVEEAFSNMFANIGKAFIDMATKMLAQQAVLSLLKALTGGSPSPSATDGAFNIGQFAGRASGGPVTGNQPYIVGEKGPELFLPGVTGTVVNNDQFEAARASMSYYGGGSGRPNNGDNGTFRLETTVINNVEYATVDQVRAMGQKSARQGATAGNALTMNNLRNSRAQRAKIGLGR